MRLLFWLFTIALVLTRAEEGSGVMDLTTEASAETTTEMLTMETTTLADMDLTTSEILTTTEMSTTTRDPIRKWNKKDLEDEYQKKVKTCEEEVIVPTEAADEPIPPCPEGWIHYKESCYLIHKKYATMAMADEICQSYDTTLFVADNYCELNFIQENAIEGHTWIGIFKKDEEETNWQAGCGMDFKELPWLIKDREYYGWNEHTRCAGMYNKDDVHYAHFFPCNRSMNFICERNATLYM